MADKEFRNITQWELVNQDFLSETLRGRVIGGWIVEKLNYSNNAIASSMVFIPDPNHKWKLD